MMGTSCGLCARDIFHFRLPPFFRMALTYSLRYQKLNHFHKVVLEKDGEVVIERQSFRLKGKGAQDQGETIYYGDMRELVAKEDELSFSTLAREKYVLTDFANLFDSFLKDFSRVRNEFLAEALFMKVGMLYHEYDCSVEIVDPHGKIVNKGKSRLQFYEGSIVVVPEIRECFVMYLDFIKSHEFDEDEYVLRVFLDNGSVVTISKLGTSFEDVQQTLESLLGSMYEKVINYLREAMPEFDDNTLLKLAYKLKNGRTLPLVSYKKMHDDMPAKVDHLVFGLNAAAKDKALTLRRLGSDEHFYLGLSFGMRPETKELNTRAWFVTAFPEKNLLAFGFTSNPQDSSVHFFRIALDPAEARVKLATKVLELDQYLLLTRFDLFPLFRDKKEIRKSRYKTAVKKLSFFRMMRKSYLGRSQLPEESQLKADFERFAQKALDFRNARL
jgi:hypothetical protein